jgi:hypothetical protein
MYRRRLLQDSTTKMYNTRLLFLTFHLEMIETKLRFLSQETNLRNQRKVASGEGRALIFLDT